jgi:hypothetical protein
VAELATDRHDGRGADGRLITHHSESSAKPATPSNDGTFRRAADAHFDFGMKTPRRVCELKPGATVCWAA